jgi:hypothetical protein
LRRGGSRELRDFASTGKGGFGPIGSPAGEHLVYVFSHGQFIQAVRSLVIDSKLTEREKMRKFWGKGSPAIGNAELMELSTEGGVWRHLSARKPMLDNLFIA